MSEYDVPLIRTITEPLPEFATDQAAFEARMSGYPPQAALAPSGSKPPATVEAPSQDAGTKKESSGSKAAKRRENLIALIEAYSESGLWGVETRQLATTAKIKLSTMYRYLEHEDVKPTWKQYQRNSIGKRPISIDDR